MAPRRAETVADTDDHGRGTKTDNAAHKRQASALDRARKRAYNEGERAGRKSRIHQRRPDPADLQEHGYADGSEHKELYEQGYGSGRKQANADRRSRVAGAVRGAVPSSAPSASDLSGFVLAVLSWAVFVNYVRGGTAGVDAWFKAKFFNEPAGSTASAASVNAALSNVAVPTPAQSIAAAVAAGGGGAEKLNQ
jgi:hypothetical protein